MNLLGAGVECDNLETKCFSLPLIHWRLGWLKLVRNLLEGGLAGIRLGNGDVIRGILFMVCSWLSESQLSRDEKSPGLSYFWHYDLLSRIRQESNHRPKSLKLWVRINVSFQKVFCQCPVLGRKSLTNTDALLLVIWVDLSLYWRNNIDYNHVESVGESVSVFAFCYFRLKIPNTSKCGTFDCLYEATVNIPWPWSWISYANTNYDVIYNCFLLKVCTNCDWIFGTILNVHTNIPKLRKI